MAFGKIQRLQYYSICHFGSLAAFVCVSVPSTRLGLWATLASVCFGLPRLVCLGNLNLVWERVAKTRRVQSTACVGTESRVQARQKCCIVML